MSSMHDPDKMALARKLLLRKKGATVAEIAKATKRSERAIRRWLWLFNADGGAVYRCEDRAGTPAYRLSYGKAKWV